MIFGRNEAFSPYWGWEKGSFSFLKKGRANDRAHLWLQKKKSVQDAAPFEKCKTWTILNFVKSLFFSCFIFVKGLFFWYWILWKDCFSIAEFCEISENGLNFPPRQTPESMFSTFGLVHNKLQNHLSIEKAAKRSV